MNKAVRNKLVAIYKKSFEHTFEAGGGYGFRYHHGVRVMNYCDRFLRFSFFKNKSINKDAVLIGALFADIGKVNAVTKTGELIYGSAGDLNHAQTGSRMIPDILKGIIKNEDTINLVAQIIAEQHNSKQTSLEAKLVKDADRFDNYGYLQIWRHVTHAHHDQRNIDRLYEYWVKERANVGAKEYLNKFNFPIIRKLATQRYKKLNQLILEIEKETKGEDIR